MATIARYIKSVDSTAKIIFIGPCIAKKAEITQKDTEAVVNAFFSTVQETLAKGENVQVIGFGTFEVRDRAARTGRNPQTGEEIKIAAAKVPAFKAGKALKDAVNK